MKQKTIKNIVSISGTSLHSGDFTTVKISPAEVDTGIQFYLSSDISKGTIKVSPQSIINTTLSTNLGNDEVSVGTIEHLMASIHALGIDNLQITVSGSEIPILDGSAIFYYRLLQSAWIVNQNSPKKYIEIDHEYMVNNDESYIKISPYDGLIIDMTIKFDHKLIGVQHYTFDVMNEDFIKIADSRTFGLMDQIEKAKSMGFLKGGSFENAIVLDDNGVVNGCLRSDDEFVKHKVVDLIGDLYINGAIKGHVKCCCSGHKLNNRLMRLISK